MEEMRKTAFLLCFVILLMLSGCAGIVKKAPPGAALESMGENALVFGMLKWIENDEEKKRVVSLKIVSAEDMKKGAIKVEQDGRFYAVVPRGSYIIYEVDWRDPWDGPHWLVPKVAFQAEDARHAYYLGTLVVNVRTKRDIVGGLWIKGFNIGVEDEGDGAMEVFRGRYPSQDVKTARALMVHDRSIPRISELENQRALVDVIRSLHLESMPWIYP